MYIIMININKAKLRHFAPLSIGIFHTLNCKQNILFYDCLIFINFIHQRGLVS